MNNEELKQKLLELIDGTPDYAVVQAVDEWWNENLTPILAPGTTPVQHPKLEANAKSWDKPIAKGKKENPTGKPVPNDVE